MGSSPLLRRNSFNLDDLPTLWKLGGYLLNRARYLGTNKFLFHISPYKYFFCTLILRLNKKISIVAKSRCWVP